MDEQISNKKRKIRGLDLIMVFLVTFFGVLFFLCIVRSIRGVAIMNPWISAMICAIVFETFLSLFAVIVGRKKLIVPVVIIAFLPSIIFTPIVWHIIIVVIATLVVIKGLYTMRATLFNTLKIDMSVIVRSGIAYISLALVIVVTSQYYFFIKNNAEIIFDAGRYVSASNMIVDYIIKKSNAENISINTMTVDEFLNFMIERVYKQNQIQDNIQYTHTNNYEKNMLVRWVGQTGLNVEKIKNNTNDQILKQMRTNMSGMVGYNLNGDEKVVNIFAEIISVQANRIMMQNVFLRENRIAIFTVVFFLVVFSLASVIRIISGFCTRFIFMLLREFKIIHVTKIKRDAEVIVF